MSFGFLFFILIQIKKTLFRSIWDQNDVVLNTYPNGIVLDK